MPSPTAPGLSDLPAFPTSPGPGPTPTWTHPSTLPPRERADVPSLQFLLPRGGIQCFLQSQEETEQNVRPQMRGRLLPGGAAGITENLSCTGRFNSVTWKQAWMHTSPGIIT